MLNDLCIIFFCAFFLLFKIKLFDFIMHTNSFVFYDIRFIYFLILYICVDTHYMYFMFLLISIKKKKEEKIIKRWLM